MAFVELFRCTEVGEPGETITLVVTSTTQDLGYPQYGTVTISISVAQAEFTLRYGCSIWAAEWKKRWFHHFVCVFCQDPAFRAQWHLPEAQEYPSSATKTVLLQGRLVELDEAIADAVVALNEAGAVTSASCQGRSSTWSSHPSREHHSQDAYVGLAEGHFPRTLVQVVEKAGFLAQAHKLRALAPVPDIAQANHQFVRLLNDWYHKTLDLSGQTYRIQPVSRSTLPVLPPIQQTTTPDPTIQRLIALGHQATSADLLALAEREDRFTRLGYGTLFESVPIDVKQETEVSEVGGDQALQAMVYRWYLRGLPPHLAVRRGLAQKEKTLQRRQARQQRKPHPNVEV